MGSFFLKSVRKGRAIHRGQIPSMVLLLNSRPSFCCRWGDGRGQGERANRRLISGSVTRIWGRGDLAAAQGLSRDARGVTLFRGFSFEWFPSFSPAIPFYFIRCDSIDSREANCRHLQSFRSMLGFCRLHLDSRKQMNLRAEDQRGKTRSSKEHQW